MFEEGKTNGFEFLPGFIDARHTALDVVDQYYFGKKQGVFSREDETRWLQIEGKLTGATLQLFREIEKKIDSLLRCHIYANWIRNGNLSGRHTDNTSVLLVQAWNSVGYTVESLIGDKKHKSFVLQPGDALYIQQGTWHTPVVLSERMTLSLSWFDGR